MVFLDWEKAFDKVDQRAIKYALKKNNVHDKLINAVAQIYTKPELNITLEGYTSKWYPQLTGIRQRCPLSPYLFTVIMSVIFDDIHCDDPNSLAKYRMIGAGFVDLLYADDTACILDDTRAMDKYLGSIEQEGLKYGLSLNKKKCVVLKTPNQREPNIHFLDGTKLTHVEEVKYLKGKIHHGRDVNKELQENIKTANMTIKRLTYLWKCTGIGNKN